MTENVTGRPTPQRPIVHSPASRWTVQRAEIWQMGLLRDGELDSFAGDRGLMSFFLGRYIRAIWQVGLLNADTIVSPYPLSIDGLALIGQDRSGDYLYADERVPEHRESGWGGVLEGIEPIPEEVVLLFHPFRYYVLYCIDASLRSWISPIELLAAADEHKEMLDQEIQRFEHMSAHPAFSQGVRTWNQEAALIIAAEPCFFEHVFGFIRIRSPLTFESYRQQVSAHRADVVEVYRSLELERVQDLHRRLCYAASRLDPNRKVHTVLRLAEGDWRLTEVKGKLGGAIYLLTMAEILRRAAEEAFGVTLTEEDEVGFGAVSQKVKDNLYGTQRLLDAERSPKNQFLRVLGLDYSVRLRWYVEGDTEFYALESVLGNYRAVELVNLRGHVAARAGRGVAFRDSLRSDLRAHIFSFVSIDGDRSDFARAVRRAAEDDEICGMFFLSTPDFEFANFDLAELEDVLWSFAAEMEIADDRRPLLHSAIAGTRSSAELFEAVAQRFPELCQIGKGQEWGRRLMAFASEQRQRPDTETGQVVTRPVVQAAEYAIASAWADYRASRRDVRTDPLTGLAVERSKL